MNAPETELELLSYIRSLTREVASTPLDQFTTTGLSSALSLSRNLASHYLNDLTRAGMVVKAGSRPVYYFSKRDLERYLQAPLSRASFSSVDELLAERVESGPRDFERLVGSDLSLASIIEQLKGAVKYPPYGLPVLICGAFGTGRTLLAEMMCEYGCRSGVLSRHARFVVVDCERFSDDHEGFVSAFEGSDGKKGWRSEAEGGLVVFREVERLDSASLDYLNAVLASKGSSKDARVAILTSLDENNPKIALLARSVPVVVHVPSLKDRSAEEREELVLDLFKEEGRRLGADVFVSRTAFACLVEADFEDNILGLRSCVTSCCAAANLDRSGDRLEVQAFLLPGSILSTGASERGMARAARLSGSGDSRLIDTTRTIERAGDSRSIRAFSAMLSAYRTHQSGGITSSALLREVLAQAQDFEDYLAFDDSPTSQRAAAFERVVADIVAEINATYGVDLSHKSSLVISRCVHAHSHAGTRLAKWRIANQGELAGLYALLADSSQLSRLVCDRIAGMVESTLGIKLDVATRIFVFAVAAAAERHGGSRQSIGIVLSHGYSTATSIADAANRILHARVFEAIDMSYDQQVKDIVVPLRGLFETYAFCKEIVVLVDMGSLEHALEEVGELANVTVGVVNNASTGIALEIGAGLLAGEPLAKLLPAATEACANRYRIVEARTLEQAVVFCSEGGAQAAERIRSLVERSLEIEVPLRFVACTPNQLRTEGVTARYDVVAAIGTDDPAIEGVRFIALESIISDEKGSGVDEVFSRFLCPEELERFHQNLVKSLTLRNVIESITILNPERVLGEVECAVERLQSITGQRLGAHTMIGLCVHLCCLIERLVTRNAIESYMDVERFEKEHPDFIEAFRQSFRDISGHYGVEVPIAEIAYAYDYVHHN